MSKEVLIEKIIDTVLNSRQLKGKTLYQFNMMFSIEDGVSYVVKHFTSKKIYNDYKYWYRILRARDLNNCSVEQLELILQEVIDNSNYFMKNV